MLNENIFRTYTFEEARQTILRRRAPDAYDVPPAMQQRLANLFGEPVTPDEAVRRILASIREHGDSAVRDWTKRIDGIDLGDFAVPEADIEAALHAVPDDVLSAMKLAARRIKDFHRMQPVTKWVEQGVGQLIRPLGRVGIYVPGGAAPLPSSLLMSAIPARVAEVKEIVVCTPPGREDGKVPSVILAAAALSGISKIYRIGGAQAVAAMAFGTVSVPRVDKIVGPGNLFVTLAKRQVFGMVGIDGLPGPTETMVIADENADPELAAADLLAQAEHDVLAAAILVTPSRQLAAAVTEAVRRQAVTLSRVETITQSLQNQGGVIIVDDLKQAFEAANLYAPEHLCLLIENARDWTGHVQNAGGVFLGEYSFEVLGDYVAGPSHVMPTSGTARFASPLNVWDFVKITSLVDFDPETGKELSQIAAVLAHAEDLTAHAAAAEARAKE
ncbi:MAG: histidinol dehydrogenase [Chloroflexi bacterium]|nr:histidinol dehydrogenase [Chloroflexota bacterium]